MPRRFGIFSSARYRVAHFDANGISEVDGWLRNWAFLGMKERVIGLYMFPRNLIDWTNGVDGNVITMTTPKQVGLEIARPTYFGGDLGVLDRYTPKNNKMFTFPYTYATVTTGSSKADFVFEKGHSNGELHFKIAGLFNEGPKVFIFPTYYDHVNNNFDYTITDSYPQVPSVCASFITVTGMLNIANKLGPLIGLAIGGVGGMAIGAGVGAAAGQAGSGGATIPHIESKAAEPLRLTDGSHLATIDPVQLPKIPKQREVTTISGDKFFEEDLPFLLGNIRTDNFKFMPGDVSSFVALGLNDVQGRTMCIRKHDAMRIDKFFSVYGYATMTIKIPNISGRRNWNYVKTRGCRIGGRVPQNVADIIRKIFDKGVTIWNYTANIGDYTQNNDIISVG